MHKGNPFMPFVEDFESEAEGFLRHYGCEAAIETPMPIPIEDIIRKRMTLDIIESQRLSPDGSVQGIIAFTKGIVQVYDSVDMRYVGLKVDEPAILIDTDIQGEAYRNQLLAHEAFHWYKHRAYFNFKNQHGLGDEFAFRCARKYEVETADSKWTDEQRMEWQARKIEPMILMPKAAFIKKLCELSGVQNAADLRPEDIDSQIVVRLAAYFHVTRHMVRRRLRGLKLMDEDESLYDSSDRYTRVAQNRRGRTSADGITPYISAVEAFDLYQGNVLFRSYLDTGMYRYTDQQFKAAVQISSGEISNHLIFSEVLMPVMEHTSQDDVMFHGDQHYETAKQFRNVPQNAELMDQLSAWEAQFQRIRERQNVNTSTANEMMWEYMWQAHWNTRIFQDKTLLSSMDYTRVQKKDYVFKLPAYVAMAVGLGLTLQEFQDVIEHAGLCLTRGNKQHDAYSFLLSTMQGQGIDVCNEFLRGLDLTLLGTQERDKN